TVGLQSTLSTIY
ncbi:hypothetical protein JL09_g6565, partial [Pichia kudriavzevii]